MRGFGLAYAIISAALLTGCMSAAEHRVDDQTDPGAAAQLVQPVGQPGGLMRTAAVAAARKRATTSIQVRCELLCSPGARQ